MLINMLQHLSLYDNKSLWKFLSFPRRFKHAVHYKVLKLPMGNCSGFRAGPIENLFFEKGINDSSLVSF